MAEITKEDIKNIFEVISRSSYFVNSQKDFYEQCIKAEADYKKLCKEASDKFNEESNKKLCFDNRNKIH